MNNGYIKLYRCLLDSKLWSCSDATLRVAIYLLLSANHRSRWVRRIKIERGQCIRSLTQISHDCNINRNTARYAIKTLETDGFITKDEPFGTHQGHRITLCKYDDYQDKEADNNTPTTQALDPALDPALDTNKNGKNVEECKNNPPNPPGGDGRDVAVIPKSAIRKSKTDQKRIRVNFNTALMIRIGEWFDRRADTLWNVYEANALLQLNPTDAEVDEVEAYYKADIQGKDYRRRNIEALLNNWQGEIDRARRYWKETKPQQKKNYRSPEFRKWQEA